MGMCGDGGELTPPILAHQHAQRQLCGHAWLSLSQPPVLQQRALALAWAERKVLGWDKGCRWRGDREADPTGDLTLPQTQTGSAEHREP